MAASKTVPQLSQSHNSIVPRHGVVTLFGYHIQVRVDRGHLLLDDGIGADRRHFRLPRVGHNLRRLVIVGADGFISLSALRWLADQGASFAMLERETERFSPRRVPSAHTMLDCDGRRPWRIRTAQLCA
jgi:hypothetical protein